MWEISRSIFCRKSSLCVTLRCYYITSHFNCTFPFAAWFSFQFFQSSVNYWTFLFTKRTDSVWSIKCIVVWRWYNGFMILALVHFSRQNTDHMCHQKKRFKLKGTLKEHLNASKEFSCINRPWMFNLRTTTMKEKVAEQNKNEKKLRRELGRTKREYDRKGIQKEEET